MKLWQAILPKRMPLGSSARRLQVLLLALAIIVTVFAGRLFQFQGLEAPAYAATAAAQMTRTIPVPAVRGTLTDRHGAVLAATSPAVLITADPKLINTPEPEDNTVDEVADLLVTHVGGDRATYVQALTKPNTQYSIVARKVPAAAYHRLSQELSAAGIYGVFRESDPIRTYPEKTTAAAVLGFVDAQSKGSGGIEYSMNSELAGVAGKEIFEASPSGYRIPLGTNLITPAQDGINYQLTIDTELQLVAERSLADAVKQSKATSGTAIVMDVKTGEVLAMANVPTFDSNAPTTAQADDLYNRAVTQAFEPGSVQKVLTLAALTDAGVMNPDTRLIVPPTIQSGDNTVKDVWKHEYANVTARGVLAYSSNIGTIMLTREADQAQFHQYLKSFGLGQPTGIELPGEIGGFLPPADMKGYTRDQISFGQGLSVTAIQEAAAIAGISNGGIYNPPTIIRSATDSRGEPVPIERREPRRVVSPETSAQVNSMMESVVGPGAFAEGLAMDEYRIGGKTGTAENFNVEKGRYEGYTASFVGVAPIEDPQIVTYVVVSDPKNGHTGGGTAGPAFSDIMRFALPRYGVLPSTGERPDESLLEWSD